MLACDNDPMATQAAAPLPIHRLDLRTYDRMVASGALEDQPVELLAGLLVDVSPHGPEHADVITRLTRHLASAQAWLRVQLPLEVPPDSVPEPDLALVEDHSATRHPRTALLVVEVAVSSHAVDRDVKTSLYAQAGVPVYWLVDVPGKTVVVHTEPTPEGYRNGASYRPGDRLASPAPGVGELDVAALFSDIAPQR